MRFTAPMADTATIPTLLQLAESRFSNISPAEQKLFEAAANAKDADCASLSEKDHIIQGDLLSWLCTNQDASAQVTYRGVSIVGAQIEGELNLECAKISFPLRISQCCITETIILRNSHLLSLDLYNTSIRDMKADNVLVQQRLSMRGGFIARNGVRLANASIGGDLLCDGGEFIGEGEETALLADGAKIQGSVFLRHGFIARNGVQLIRTTIGGHLDCDDGEIIREGREPALNANGAKVEGSVLLRDGFKAEGGVNFVSATIGGDLECRGGELICKGDAPALDANGAKVEGSVLLRDGLKAEGGVNFVRAYVGRYFQWSRVQSPENSIIDLRFTRVGTLFNGEDSWPKKGNIQVDGLVYDSVFVTSGTDI